MKQTRLLIVAVLVSTSSLFAQFDPSSVQWDAVKSKVGWLNLYSEPAMLSLTVDKFPALKKVKPIGYYSQTLFPFGQFNCEIFDSRNGKKIDEISAKIENGQSYSFVTFGSDKVSPVTILIHEQKDVEVKGTSRLTIYNGFPDREMFWNLSSDKPSPVLFGKSVSTTFASEVGYKGAVRVRLDGGKEEVLQVSVGPGTMDSNWIAFCHFDQFDFKLPQVSYLQEGFGVFLEAGEPSKAE